MGNAEANLAPNTIRRSSRRNQTYQMTKEIMKEYDTSKTGSLSRQEVKDMAAQILSRHAPQLGSLEYDEIELIMRCGGKTVKPEITAEELPEALAIITSITEQNENLIWLFRKYDLDKSGDLSLSQLKPLLQEANGGTEPTDDDVSYILKQCEPRGREDPIGVDQLKAALACWYCLAEDNSEMRQEADIEQEKKKEAAEEKIKKARNKKAEEDLAHRLAEELKRKEKEMQEKAKLKQAGEAIDGEERRKAEEATRAEEERRKAEERAKAEEEQRRREEAEQHDQRRKAEQAAKAEEEKRRVEKEQAAKEAAELAERAAQERAEEPQQAPGLFSSLLRYIGCTGCAPSDKGQDLADAEVPATIAGDDKLA